MKPQNHPLFQANIKSGGVIYDVSSWIPCYAYPGNRSSGVPNHEGKPASNLFPVSHGSCIPSLPGLLFCRQLARAHELFAEGQQKLGVQHDGVVAVVVAGFHIEGVDMIGRGCGDFNDLAAQAFDQRAVGSVPFFAMGNMAEWISS